ncbi:MAG: PIN domain-containing protein [Chloroflexi bacterium]|nr:PIN domain-containing protein [Chloroflexota bacterium]
MVTFLDTNILIHYLTGQDEGKAQRCLQLLQLAERREVELAISELVIAEVVWVLESQTDLARTRIRDLLLPIVRLPGLRLPAKRTWPRVFDLYCERKVDFIDAYHVVCMERLGITRIYSYDTDFDRIDGIERITP